MSSVLEDEDKTPIARLQPWATGFKGHKLEMVSSWVDKWGEGLVDEIVVTAFAMTELRRRRNNTGGIGAGPAAGGVAGVAV